MSRPLVLHAADLHLDAPFEGIGRAPAHVAAALRDASLATWDALVELAIGREVAALLLAGGLCDGLERGVRAQARLRDGIARLAGAGIRVFIALGDRDPLDGFAAIPRWPHGVTVFPAGEPTAVGLECDGVRIATVHGVSASGQRRTAVAPRFVRGDEPGPHFAVLHADCAADLSDDGGCTPCRLADLRAADIDYWALGHAHGLDYRSTGAPWIVYPGTPQGRGLLPAECGPKGAVLVEIADGAIARVDFEPLDRVRCLHVEVAGAAEPAALVNALTARAAELRDRHRGRALVLDAQIGAAPPAGSGLRSSAVRAELLHGLRRAAASWQPFVWWAGLRVVASRVSPVAAGDPSAAPAVHADGAPACADLAAEIERRRAELTGDGEQCARFLARRFEPLRDAWTADLDPRDTGVLLDEAASLAIDVLRADGA